MRRCNYGSFKGRRYGIDFFGLLVLDTVLLSLLTASPIFGAELSVEYTTIARTGVTTVPEARGPS